MYKLWRILKGQKVQTAIFLILYCVVVFLPPVIYGYVYPNAGDDSAFHLVFFERMQNGDVGIQVLYLGYWVVGRSLVFLSNITNVGLNVLYLWFYYGALTLIGLVFYFVGYKIFNRRVGWMALLLSVFCSQGVLFLFYYGQIFDLINMGIIFPLLLLSIASYLRDRKWWKLSIFILLGLLFSVFHLNGVYLPVIIGFATTCYVLYCVFKKQKVEKHIVAIGGISTVCALIVYLSLLHLPLSKPSEASLVLVPNYVVTIITPSLMILISVVLADLKRTIKSIKSLSQRVTVVMLASGVAVLTIVAFGELSVYPWRQAVDMAILLSFLVAIFVGLSLERKRSKVVIAIVFVSIVFGLFNSISVWFDNNSAMKKVDENVLVYMNANGYKTFSCSPEVAPWIYSRFTDIDWVQKNGEVLIVRNIPMTAKSNKASIWYEGHGFIPDENYRVIKSYTDGNVSVSIYERNLDKSKK